MEKSGTIVLEGNVPTWSHLLRTFRLHGLAFITIPLLLLLLSSDELCHPILLEAPARIFGFRCVSPNAARLILDTINKLVIITIISDVDFLYRRRN